MRGRPTTPQERIYIGPQLHARRVTLGITQDEFAVKTGLSQGVVSRLESNQYDAGFRAMARILRFLGISREEFLATRPLKEDIGLIGHDPKTILPNGEMKERMERLPDWAKVYIGKLTEEIKSLNVRISALARPAKFELGEITHGNGKQVDVSIPQGDYVRFWLDGEYIEIRPESNGIRLYTGVKPIHIHPSSSNMITVEVPDRG